MNVKNAVMNVIAWMTSTQMCTVYVLVILCECDDPKNFWGGMFVRSIKESARMDYRFTALLIVLMVALALLGGPADYNTP
jgi:hypothetical protein